MVGDLSSRSGPLIEALFRQRTICAKVRVNRQGLRAKTIRIPMRHLSPLLVAAVMLVASAAQAQQSRFTTGPVISDYGAVAEIESAAPVPPETVFKVAFDVSEAGTAGEISRRLESPARFLNMHVRAGIPLENIHLVVVVHGPAARDLMIEPRPGETNANAGLVAALVANGVDIVLCGQTAANAGIEPDSLLPGVRLSLSAMTSFALLQQDGYTVNPF
jgi:intracellular sulfur oxidation DsrE/DsrF family protein